MASEKIWRQRIGEWRASGQKSEDFCSGRGFSAGLLRHWAWRLGLTERRYSRRQPPSRESVRVARVVRNVPVPSAAAVPAVAPGGIRIEVGRAVVEVRAGFDSAALSAVLDLLDGRLKAEETR